MGGVDFAFHVDGQFAQAGCTNAKISRFPVLSFHAWRGLILFLVDPVYEFALAFAYDFERFDTDVSMSLDDATIDFFREEMTWKFCCIRMLG